MAKTGWTIYANKKGMRGGVLCVWGDMTLAQGLGFNGELSPEDQAHIDQWEALPEQINRVWCEGALQMYEMQFVEGGRNATEQ